MSHHRIRTRLLLLGTAAVVVAAAEAQRPLSAPAALRLAGHPLELLILLARQDVRSELELIGDQLNQIGELSSKSRRSLRERFASLRIGGVENARQRIREMAVELRQEIDRELQLILLPHQVARLRQLQIQFAMQMSSAGFLNNQIADQLGLTDDQRRELRQKAQQLDAEVRQKVAILRAGAHQEMIALLSPPQQQRLNEMTGRPFRFADQPPGEATGNQELSGPSNYTPTDE